MVDFKKHLPDAQKTTRAFGEAQAREERRLHALFYGLDLRPAAEIMAEDAEEMRNPLCSYARFLRTAWHSAGPPASAIFNDRVMREQVDPS